MSEENLTSSTCFSLFINASPPPTLYDVSSGPPLMGMSMAVALFQVCNDPFAVMAVTRTINQTCLCEFLCVSACVCVLISRLH